MIFIILVPKDSHIEVSVSGGTPSFHPLMEFPWNKPTSYGSSPMTMETPMWIPSRKLTVCYWKLPSRNSWFTHKKNVIFHSYLVGGFNLPLWKMMEFVSWDDDIPKIWTKIIQMFQSTKQLCYPPVNQPRPWQLSGLEDSFPLNMAYFQGLCLC